MDVVPAIDASKPYQVLHASTRSSRPSSTRLQLSIYVAQKSAQAFARSFTVDEAAAAELVRKGKEEGMLLGQDALRLLEIYGIPAVAGTKRIVLQLSGRRQKA